MHKTLDSEEDKDQVIDQQGSISSQARRNQTSILVRGRENHVFPLNLTDRQTYGRILVFIE